jgi:hypothetical protein
MSLYKFYDLNRNDSCRDFAASRLDLLESAIMFKLHHHSVSHDYLIIRHDHIIVHCNE